MLIFFYENRQYKEEVLSTDYHLCMGQDTKEYFSIPPEWTPLYYTEAKEETPILSIEEMTGEALAKPAKTPPLKDLLSGAPKIAIIIDDCTRPTPVADILGVLLPYLIDNGIPQKNVTIVVALGTHNPITSEDLAIRVGKNVVANYKIVQHNAWQSDLVPVSLDDDGMVVKINPEVARADVKIGISSILPHPMAGYGGGPKIIMPGVANFEYIRAHHMLYTIDPRSTAGKLKGNPFHEACMKVARAVGLDFSINCVYNRLGEITRIIGGNLDTAFAAAVEVCFKKLGVKIEEKVDVTITSTYPHTHAHQFVKALDTPDMITKETGAILLAVPTVVPIADDFINSFGLVRKRSHDNSAAFVKDAMSKGMPFLPDKPLEFNMAMKCAIIRPKIRTIVVSPMISGKEARTMGFEHAPSISAGINMIEHEHPSAKVAIFPSGGLVVPITDWER
ncbi:MAG: hypothetical protein C0399_07310 [Syntrophus sp. (in: bacteria)]|nr:hypothetical protein [Syntrophus sp. (in: bacteria)]